MTPLELSARLLAAVWLAQTYPDEEPADVLAFVDEHWPAFLAHASASMGRLLLGIDTPEGRRAFDSAVRDVERAAGAS